MTYLGTDSVGFICNLNIRILFGKIIKEFYLLITSLSLSLEEPFHNSVSFSVQTKRRDQKLCICIQLEEPSDQFKEFQSTRLDRGSIM